MKALNAQSTNIVCIEFNAGAELRKYIAGFIFLFVLFLLMAWSAYATEIEYHPRLGAIPLDDEVRVALKKFPDLASCLKPGAVKDGKADLNAIDWDKIRNDGDAKVCLFVIFERLAGPEEVKAWLTNQGFSAWGPFKRRSSPSVLESFGYDVSSKVYNSYKNLSVGGGWSLRWHFPKFPTGGFARYYRPVLSRAQNIGVTWFPDGKLMNVRITYQSIFN